MRHLSRTAVALAVGSVISMGAQADILITEYVEGGGYNKAIEIGNTGEQPVDITGYKLIRYTDGDQGKPDELILSGVIAAKDVLVMVTADGRADPKLKALADEFQKVVKHNGDDPYELFDTDGNLIDQIGEFGDKDFAKDKTLQRTNLTPSKVYDASKFAVLDKDTWADLGQIGEVILPPDFECKTEDGLDPTFTSINSIQGAGDKSPLIESGYITEGEYFVRGVVTARGESLFKGFYLEALDADGDDATSDGLFVSIGAAPSDDIKPGVEVCVKGKVQEFYNLTQLSSDNNSYKVTATDNSTPKAHPLIIKEGETLAQALERHEGMKVLVDQDTNLVISRQFSYDYASKRNNMVLSHKAPLMKPTQIHPALSDGLNQLSVQNKVSQVFVETDEKAGNGVPSYFTKLDAVTYPARVGAQVTDVEAMVAYSWGEYRLALVDDDQQVSIADLAGNERTDAPKIASKGDLRVASFNVLNFFNSIDGGAANPLGTNRGALDAADVAKQEEKIVAAIKAMNADIVGLMEIENNGFSDLSAIYRLTDSLNKELPVQDHYKFIRVGNGDATRIGTDAITVGMLYRPSKVKLTTDQPIVIDLPTQSASFEGTKDGGETTETVTKFKGQRSSLLQTFDVLGKDEQLTVVVNHFKSKGSSCQEDYDEYVEPIPLKYGDLDKDKAEHVKGWVDDLQGSCNDFRVSAATVLANALSKVQGDLLVIGDLNAYGMEDPVRVLTSYDPEKTAKLIKTAVNTKVGGVEYQKDAVEVGLGHGLINMNTMLHGAGTFSYSYSGELGNLDHALVNESLVEHVMAIEDWHINSIESDYFEYPSKFRNKSYESEKPQQFYDNGPYSASDHDPVLIALDYTKKKVEQSSAISVGGAVVIEYALADNAKVGDIVTITVDSIVQNKSFSSNAITKEVELTQADISAGFVSVKFDKLEAKEYKVTKILKDRYGNVKSVSTEIIKVTEDSKASGKGDNTNNGGSFGFGALLALAGLGWTRRRRT